MSKLPSTVTYLVGIDHGVERSLCIEASAVVRLIAFARRCGSVHTVSRPLGIDHRNRRLSPAALTVLSRQLYRHLNRNEKRKDHETIPAYHAGSAILQIDTLGDLGCQFQHEIQQPSISQAINSLHG